jgi:hypothetical protein
LIGSHVRDVRSVLAVVGLCWSVACSADRVAAPHRHILLPVGGSDQVGMPNAALLSGLTVRLVDENGTAQPSVTIRWFTDGGGRVSPIEATTDAFGTARAEWTLGPADGIQKAIATDGGDTVEFRATVGLESGARAIAPVAMYFKTVDGSGQTVHPDFVAMPHDWPAASQYLVLTPYQNGDITHEWPSLFQSTDQMTWSIPPGIQNPIAPHEKGHLSDPDALYNPARRELWVYYRQVTNKNTILLITSKDGKRFSAPVAVVEGPNHTIVSPSVVRRRGGEWHMWAVNGGFGCTAASSTVEVRHSGNGIDWSDPVTVSLDQPGLFAWHIEVQWIPSRHEYWALYNAKQPKTCNTEAVYLATSADGITWKTFPSPVLERGAFPEFSSIVYRSTFNYDPKTDVISFWYSGARYLYEEFYWGSAFQRRTRAELFASINQVPDAATLSRRSQAPRHRLVNPP